MARIDDMTRLVEASPYWRTLTEIYPGLLPRLEHAVAQADPQIQAAVEGLLRHQSLEIDPFDGRFGFTPAEQRLARHLMAGASTRDYATRHGLSANTVRNQLQAIYEKTGVNRQAALVSLLFESVSPAAG